MVVLKQITSTIRYMRDVPSFLGHTITEDEARSMIVKQLASREEAFVYVVKRAIYSQPASPYHKLLQHVGVELGDFRRLVATDGVEGALGKLHDAGVYVTPERRHRATRP